MNKHEYILQLKSPKLMGNIIKDIKNNQPTIELNSIVNVPVYDTKNEKKNKLNYKNIDVIENKKSKNKQKKKSKNKVYVAKNISDFNEELEISHIKSMSFVRNSKSLKNKKVNKEKVSLDINIYDNIKQSKNIYLDDLLSVQQLATKLDVPSSDIIKWLFLQGISVTINQSLDISISTLVAEHYLFKVLKRSTSNATIVDQKIEKQYGKLRAPVIILFGHVDHGKTTLLQAIKQDHQLIQEAGKITQTIGCYEIVVDAYTNVNKLIFLDTPGHEAFINMRERGAEISDLAVLVVSADDGLKPQTIEAISYIQGRNLPFIVAINKIDKANADLNKVKKQLLKFNVTDQDVHGNQIIIGVSALTGKNIDLLLSSLISLSKSLQLKSDPSKYAQGTVLEAHLDKQRGPVAQLLIQNGTLYKGNIIVSGNMYGKVKAIHDSVNRKVKQLESTALAEVLCFTEVPDVGLSFKVVDDEKTAKALAAKGSYTNTSISLLNHRISLEDTSKKSIKCIIKQVNFIIKTNSKGSIQPIIYALSQIPQEKVQINLLFVSSGEVSFKDIDLSSTSNSIVLAFDLNISANVIRYAEKMAVRVKSFKIIYDLIDYVKQHMLEFVDIDYEKEVLGYAEVKNTFGINKGVVAGCFIQSGKLKKNAYFQIKRKNQNIYTGLLDSLKKVKEDVDELLAGNECGVLCKEYHLWEFEDILECYELKPLEKTL